MKKRIYVDYKCPVCGSITKKRQDSVKRRKSCGCSRYQRKVNPEVAYKRLYKKYKRGAEDRDLEFTLSYKHFKGMITSPCSYCGSDLSSLLCSSKNNCVEYNGIDRANNDVGYTKNNCVTCCGTCNIMKGSLGQQEFLIKVALISAHQVKLNSVNSGEV